MDALGFLGSMGRGVLEFFGAQQQNERLAEAAAQNVQLQREFATRGIQWKVRDAQKAGIHPLYAVGAQTHAFAPVSVGSVNEFAGPARALEAMGQDLSRAASANVGPQGRLAAVTAVAQEQELQAGNLRLENMQLQNQLLRSRLALVNQPGTPPGIDFVVPEKNKPGERPPLMLENERLDTSAGTSPIKEYSDQYGDENIMVQQVLGNLMLGRDYLAHLLNNPAYNRFAREILQKVIPSRFGLGQLPLDTRGKY